MLRVVADLGNSRLKMGRLDEAGRLVETLAVSVDDPTAWAAAWAQWDRLNPGSSSWAISTVNPPVSDRLDEFLRERQISDVRWYRSATEVPVKHALDHPEWAGVDRALAITAAVRLKPSGRPGLLVSCGTALVIERITAEGVWQGGTIGPGLGTSARALHLRTAMLPLIEVRQAPAAWSPATLPAMESGIFWGMVGAIREIVTRQSADLGEDPWIVYTGGDAELLAPHVSGREARIVPNLVLLGLSQLALPHQ